MSKQKNRGNREAKKPKADKAAAAKAPPASVQQVMRPQAATPARSKP
jgi:hypothetical protein